MKKEEFNFIKQIRNIEFLLGKLLIETNSKNKKLYYEICNIGSEKELCKILVNLGKIQQELIEYFENKE